MFVTAADAGAYLFDRRGPSGIAVGDGGVARDEWIALCQGAGTDSLLSAVVEDAFTNADEF